MIPGFDDNGALPPGVYQATLAEVEERFGRQSEPRRVQMESVRWMVDLARRAGVERTVLNGSFVTDIIEPNDVDCVLLFVAGELKERAAFRELRKGLPFLDIALVGQKNFDNMVNRIFSADRHGMLKGMVEVTP
jgi:hypothetical protein